MRLGLSLMNAGETSSPSALLRIAQHAEDLGYDSLWVTEREPFPLTAWPQYSIFTGELVVSRKPISCTMEALALAAVQTERIRLGISLPNVPYYSPLAVGQSLAALDVLSDGRVQVGLGLGWTAGEFEAVASSLSRPETPASEFVRVLRTVWDGCEDGFTGDHYTIPCANPCSTCAVTPVQQPYPPIVLTAFAPAAVQAPATLLRGGAPLVLESSRQEMADALRTVTTESSASTDGLDVVVRAVVRPTDAPLGDDRAMFSGSIEQLRDDIAFSHALGVAELEFDLSAVAQRQGCERLLSLMGDVRDLVPATGPAPASTLAPVAAAA